MPDPSQLDPISRILEELATYSEQDRREILRSHVEIGFSPQSLLRDKEAVKLRRQLDLALNEITDQEIRAQIGLASAPVLPSGAQDPLSEMTHSGAFLQYVNSYCYFAVRFAAGRRSGGPLAQLSDARAITADPTSSSRVGKESREAVFGFFTPPIIDTVGRQDIDRWYTDFRSLINLGDPSILDFKDSPRATALAFLDGFIEDIKEPIRFELWLRGLLPEVDNQSRFSLLHTELKNWAIELSSFFLALPDFTHAEYETRALIDTRTTRPIGGWRVSDPLAGRLGLSVLYWIARALGAEILASGTVNYSETNWMRLLIARAELQASSEEDFQLRRAEEILRSVLNMSCDLIQNAAEVTQEEEQKWSQETPPRDLGKRAPITPAGTRASPMSRKPTQEIKSESSTVPPHSDIAKWREVFDEEMREVDAQRSLRRFDKSLFAPEGQDQTGNSPEATWPPGGGDGDSGPAAYWSERLRNGKRPRNLVGLAFSGGGIRSATFNLGILQGLQEKDLLRDVDYLSTVSGGGFIGSWVASGVLRDLNWLSKRTEWRDSIAHLRRYSSYLSPQTGIFQSDFWTMWGSWIRNAILIQLTGLAWLLALFVLALTVGAIFKLDGLHGSAGSLVLLGILALCCVLYFAVLFNLRFDRTLRDVKNPFAKNRVLIWIVTPLWLAAFVRASLLWKQAAANEYSWSHGYSSILASAWIPWLPFLIIALVGFAGITWLVLAPIPRRWRVLRTIAAPIFPVVSLYLLLCGVVRLYVAWVASDPNLTKFHWYALVFGPVLVAVCDYVTIVLFLGFSGIGSAELSREWCTRLVAWLGIFSLIYVLITSCAVFGPALLLWALEELKCHPKLEWGSVIAWVGSVAGGLLSGSSSKTSGDPSHKNNAALEWIAKIGAVLFLLGAATIASCLLYGVLTLLSHEDPICWSDHWSNLEMGSGPLIGSLMVLALCGLLFGYFFEINIFGLNQFYRNRIVRCYLGATRFRPGERRPQPFTDFDESDDLKLWQLRNNPPQPETPLGYPGPFPIYNCALNLGGSSDLSVHTRHSASFTLTPLRCGCDRRLVGYAPTLRVRDRRRYAGGVSVGQAVSISGAAVSPNMGYSTSSVVAFLLTMFNVRLGWWFPNPGGQEFNTRREQPLWARGGLRSSPWYLSKELFGMAGEMNHYVNVSDGGHFENLAIYELIRRRCKVIIAGDAECDEALTFGSLGNLVRICETDFGARIEIDVNSIRRGTDGLSHSHCTVGTIKYSNGSIGYLLYFKASLTGDEPVGVSQYQAGHPTFPHESTADQFFSEDQFDAYRMLGRHIVEHTMANVVPGSRPVAVVERLADVTAAQLSSSELRDRHMKELSRIWNACQELMNSDPLARELLGLSATAPQAPTEPALGAEVLGFMEQVFLDLRLDEFWTHPDNRGWAMLFQQWARSPHLRQIWLRTRQNYGIRFEYFCDLNLGLPKGVPVSRVS